MKVLILTCNTGEGHNSAGGAVKDVFEQNGHQCDIADSMQFMSKRIPNLIGKFHDRMYRYVPSAFNKGYAMLESKSPQRRTHPALYWLMSTGAPRLRRYIRNNGYDAAICVHPFAAIMLTRVVKKYDKPLLTGIIATDYTCVPTTSASELDVYFVPHEDVRDDFIRAGIPAENIFASGIPVKQTFYTKMDKQEAKKVIDFPEDKRHVLLMCGSMGCGPLKDITQTVSASLPEDVILTVMCGRNERLRRQLSEDAGDNVNIMGFTDKVSQFMDSADLYLTKPGGLSTTEAAAKRLPMVFIDAVSGCETYNKNFFVNRHCALPVDSIEDFPQVINEYLNDEKRLQESVQRLESEFQGNAAENIFNYIISHAKTVVK